MPRGKKLTTQFSYFITLVIFIFAPSVGAVSSIDAMGLPAHPENRYTLQEFESLEKEELIWYTFYRYYMESGQEVKHGLWITRMRSRDRERFDTDFEEKRVIYYEGVPSNHSVESVWIDGVLRERVFTLSENLVIKITYNDDGKEIMEGKANARGGRAKRERIVRVFNDVYELTP